MTRWRVPLALKTAALTFWHWQSVRKISSSKLFVEQHYVAQNPEVRSSGLSPALHYAAIGGRQLREVSPLFDRHSLLQLWPNFKPGKHNPVVFLERHYVARGRAVPPARICRALDAANMLQVFQSAHAASDGIDIPSVDIIVPVHNNAGKLDALLSSLLQHTDEKHTIILIDDASSQAAVATKLNTFTKTRANTELVSNPRNIGYAASVNLGLRRSDNHKVILNSDTVVPAGWVDTLLEPIVRNPQIASVTPYSNASSYTGFPQNRIELPFDDHTSLAQTNAALSRFNALDRDILCGVGFCMALNSAALRSIGYLDEIAFGQGYFEDTEWCYRARRAGFRNVLANRLFVAHDHTSASFGLRRKLAALRRSAAEMRKLHKTYFDEMDEFYFTDPHAELRLQCATAISCGSTAQKTTAVVTSGDVCTTVFKHMAAPDAVLLHVQLCPQGAEVTAYTHQFGHIELKGTQPEVLDLLFRLQANRMFIAPSCSLKNLQALLWRASEVRDEGECNITVLGNDARAIRKIDAASSSQIIVNIAANPVSAEEWRELLAWPKSDPTICIAVLGMLGHRKQPGPVTEFINYIVRAEKVCRVLVFGEMPDEDIEDPKIMKTGLYRPENIPAILHRHGVNVVYFAASHEPWFACARQIVMETGLPVAIRESRTRAGSDTVHPNEAIVPAGPAERTYDALNALHLSHQIDV